MSLRIPDETLADAQLIDDAIASTGRQRAFPVEALVRRDPNTIVLVDDATTPATLFRLNREPTDGVWYVVSLVIPSQQAMKVLWRAIANKQVRLGRGAQIVRWPIKDARIRRLGRQLLPARNFSPDCDEITWQEGEDFLRNQGVPLVVV